MKNLKELYFGGKKEKKEIDNAIGNDGCTAIFNNSKYISKLEKLILWSNKE